MADQATPWEITASPDDLEAAIQLACAERGLARHEVEVDVLAPGDAASGERARLRLSLAEAHAEDDGTLRLARETLEELLQKMRLPARVMARWETGEEQERMLLLDVEGDDLSLLIGRKGETLDALQYITRQIVAKELQSGVNLAVDVAGFRQRRVDQLQRLARRMAEQAVQRGRTLSLEPMPAHERRIIHLELRNHPEVTTESVGEGDRRKVTIIPKDS